MANTTTSPSILPIVTFVSRTFFARAVATCLTRLFVVVLVVIMIEVNVVVLEDLVVAEGVLVIKIQVLLINLLQVV